MDEKTFSVNDAITGLWDKLGGWLDAIILKLPNFAVAILVMVIFYFLARILSKFSRKVLLKKINEESIKQMLSKIIFAMVLLVGFFIVIIVISKTDMNARQYVN